ncbi:MAG: hypothetical protein ACTSW7_01050 [Candidatus Thorarchaeota archaeon]|nr:MAG: hypothetical protein DRQ25_04865 [Candidatus Fermentibacteria bacterium]HEC72038.1 hypothetical protein [Thermoplasmatales archaeon]
MPHNPEKYMANRYRRGTPEYLWRKWYQKFWKAYPRYAQDPRGEPPSFMRDEFIRDVMAMVERELAKIAPEKTILKDE